MKIRIYTIAISILFIISCQTEEKSTHAQKPIITIEPSIVVPLREYTKNELLGKVSPSLDSNFVQINAQYTSKSKIYLKKDTYNSYIKMYDEALKEGLNLKIVSAFRSFNSQKSIWEAKWNGKRKINGKFLPKTGMTPKERAIKILEYSSMPGSSRHHWGTDIDLLNLNNSYFESGKGLKVYNWLVSHGPDFGFYQVYTTKDENRPTGYNEEKWHWSYRPISGKMLEAYQNKITIKDITAFNGSQTAQEINIIKNYVLGINKQCFLPLQKK